MIALLVVVGCTHPQHDSDPPTPTPTVDTDTDLAPHTGHWLTFITQLEGFGASIAVVETEPELIVAIVRRGHYGDEGVRLVQGWVFAVDVTGETLEERVEFPTPEPYTLSAWSQALGDVTGDGIGDVGVVTDGSFVEAGPFTSPRPAEPDMMDFGPFACDADATPPRDVCRVDGIDLGPIDGILDASWVLEHPLISRTLTLGRGVGYHWQYTNFFEPVISRVPLELRGTVQLDGLPTWTPTDLRPDAMAVLDAHADGSDDLLVCGTVRDGPTGLRLLDAFPEDSPVRLQLPAPCDALEVADFTGDGLPEVAVGTGSRLLVVDPRTWTVLAEHRGLRDPLQDGLGIGMDSADLNGDGRMDLLVGAPWVGRVYVLTEVVPEP